MGSATLRILLVLLGIGIMHLPTGRRSRSLLLRVRVVWLLSANLLALLAGRRSTG